jgi:single-stranded DNA-binding protein
MRGEGGQGNNNFGGGGHIYGQSGGNSGGYAARHEAPFDGGAGSAPAQNSSSNMGNIEIDDDDIPF